MWFAIYAFVIAVLFMICFRNPKKQPGIQDIKKEEALKDAAEPGGMVD